MVNFYFIAIIHFFLSFTKSRVLLLASFLVLLFVAGGRDFTVGTDTLNYYLNFQYYLRGGERETELLWHLLNRFVIAVGGDFDLLKLMASFLTLLPFYWGILKKSSQPMLSIFIYIAFYYYFYSFNIVRQCIAMSWVFLALAYYSPNDGFKSNVKSLLFFCIGFGFHSTALIGLVMAFSQRFFNSDIKRLFALVMSALIGLVFNQLILLIARSYSLAYVDVEEVHSSLLTSIINLLVLNGAFYFVSILIKNEFKDKWFHYFFWFIMLTNLMIRIPFGDRFIMYAGITLAIFLVNLGLKMKINNSQQKIVGVLVVLYCLWRFSRIVGAGETLPYSSELLNLYWL